MNTKLLIGSAGTALMFSSMAVQASLSEGFQSKTLDRGYNLAAAHAEAKCGEGKCGEAKQMCEDATKCAKEAKCGEAKCGADKSMEAKCGEAKCGADKKAGEAKCGEGKCGATS